VKVPFVMERIGGCPAFGLIQLLHFFLENKRNENVLEIALIVHRMTIYKVDLGSSNVTTIGQVYLSGLWLGVDL
jgi:hypothetical protein